MKILSKSSEYEMVALFLKEEISSKRFKNNLLTIINNFKVNINLIIDYNLNNKIENDIRKKILSEYRGYNKNKEIFKNFPKNIEWFWCEIDISDILNIKYINYDYWIELTNGTRYIKDSKENILKNKEIYGISNQSFLKGANFLKNGGIFEPLILLVSKENNNEIIVLEGHNRLASISLVLEKINKLKTLVGFVKRKDLFKWNKY